GAPPWRPERRAPGTGRLPRHSAVLSRRAVRLASPPLVRNRPTVCNRVAAGWTTRTGVSCRKILIDMGGATVVVSTAATLVVVRRGPTRQTRENADDVPTRSTPPRCLCPARNRRQRRGRHAEQVLLG